MALTTICSKCTRSSGFEVARLEVSNAPDDVMFVRCKLCGAVAGIITAPTEQITKELERLQEKVKDIEERLDGK